MTKCVLPWYNCPGCLGIKHQLTYLLVLLACPVKGCCAMHIGQPPPAVTCITVFSMLIGQPPPAVTCITVFSMLIGQPPPAVTCITQFVLIGQPPPAVTCITVFSMLIGQPPPAVTCITQFSPCLLDSLLLLLPALHSFLHAYWTASSCHYLHYSFLFKEGDSNYWGGGGGWKACCDINQGDKGTDIPSQLWCLFTSPKSCLASVFLPHCISVLCRGGNSQAVLIPTVCHNTDWHTCSGEHRGRWCLGWSWFSPCGPEPLCGPVRELTVMVCV